VVNTLQTYINDLQQAKGISARRHAGIELCVYLLTDGMKDLDALLEDEDHKELMNTIRQECKQFMSDYSTDEYAYQWGFSAYKLITLHEMNISADHTTNFLFLWRVVSQEDDVEQKKKYIKRLLTFVSNHHLDKEDLTRYDFFLSHTCTGWIQEYHDDTDLIERIRAFLTVLGEKEEPPSFTYDHQNHHC
jgi:hypothetical protein